MIYYEVHARYHSYQEGKIKIKSRWYSFALHEHTKFYTILSEMFGKRCGIGLVKRAAPAILDWRIVHTATKNFDVRQDNHIYKLTAKSNQSALQCISKH